MMRIILLSAIIVCGSSTMFYDAVPYRPYELDSYFHVLPEVHENVNKGVAPIQFGPMARPNYLKMYTVLKDMENYAINKLSKVTAKPSIDNGLHHYALLMGLLLSIAKAFADAKPPTSYDQIYLNTLDSMAPKVWKDPVSYAHEVINLIKSTRDTTTMARNFLHFTCEVRHYSSDTCDITVNYELNRLPKSFKDSIESLTTLSDVAATFSRHSKRFDKVSKDYNTIQFLIKERNMLRPLINKIVKALSILNPEQRNGCRL